MLAVKQGQTEVVKMLLDAGADPLIADLGGNTAESLAPSGEIKNMLRRKALATVEP
jgi:hypothetical protein